MWRAWFSEMAVRLSFPWVRWSPSMDISAPTFWACLELLSRWRRMATSLLFSPRSILGFVRPIFRSWHCPVELAAGSAGQLHLECNPFRGGAILYYGLVCAALPVFRRKQPGAAMFRLPAGTCVRGFRRGNLRRVDYRREPGRIADPAGDRAGGVHQLAAGEEAAGGYGAPFVVASARASACGQDTQRPCHSEAGFIGEESACRCPQNSRFLRFSKRTATWMPGFLCWAPTNC